MDKPLSGSRVLLVEDEIIVSWLLQDMLADLGYEVVGPAARVDQALAIIQAEDIDAVLLDLNLNGQMSYPVADALVARGRAPVADGRTERRRGSQDCRGPRARDGCFAVPADVPADCRLLSGCDR